jgi:hypothetical protein
MTSLSDADSTTSLLVTQRARVYSAARAYRVCFEGEIQEGDR